MWGGGPQPSLASFTSSSRKPKARRVTENRHILSAGRRDTREKRALRRAGIRRGNSLPEGEIHAIATVIELDIIGIIIIIIISTIYTAISTAASRHRYKTLLDTACSGSFTRNKEEFKWDLLDRIQENTEGWENDKGRVSDIEEERLLEILKKHRGAIGYTLDDLKGISPAICQHAINIEDGAKPVVEHQRRLIPKMKDVVRNEVLKLLEAGIIYPIADSRWVSPVHCVPKKGGIIVVPNDNDELIPQRVVVGYRMCIDFRKVNKVTKKDHYPLPFIDQMLERLSKNTHFCFLDGYSGFSQIAVRAKDQEKTTFTCPYGTYAYRRMPFGLCNAPATFQRCMSAIFHGFCEKIVEVFMDDFSVYGNSFDNCLRNLDKVLQRCEETNLVLDWEKYHFMVNEGIVLGHKISERGIEVDRAKVEAIEKMPYPRDVKGSVLDLEAPWSPTTKTRGLGRKRWMKGLLPPALSLNSFPCVEEAIRVTDEFCDQYRALRREVEILQEENKRLRRMLEYYSIPITRSPPPHLDNNESLRVLVQNCQTEKLKLKEICKKREKNPPSSPPEE
ncbi:hypothetical protein QYE76_053015 [Lolium multiflorum]|uniref:Reverse transcriptase domain-containing protein n=1 Tax=Lolium multiflorum TaxID=4521 RepID=A0AAD8WK11_LOLMU|nr:hypothetical protein QYE76_053015 [Lolium multiflorum]